MKHAGILILFISWDGAHYSQAANQLVAKWILNGLFTDPPISITKKCKI